MHSMDQAVYNWHSALMTLCVGSKTLFHTQTWSIVFSRVGAIVLTICVQSMMMVMITIIEIILQVERDLLWMGITKTIPKW